MDLVDHVEVVGRLELHLHRQAGALLDGVAALGHVPGAAVDALRAAGGEGRVDRAVEGARGDRHLGKLRRRLLDDGAAGLEGQFDSAEPALIRRRPVGAGLHDRAGEGVQVHQADLPVRHAVGRGEVVELGSWSTGGGGDALAPPVDPVALVLRPEHVWRRVGLVAHGRDRHGHAFDPEHSRVGRAGTPLPGLQLRLDPQSHALQIHDQLCHAGRDRLDRRRAAGRDLDGNPVLVGGCHRRPSTVETGGPPAAAAVSSRQRTARAASSAVPGSTPRAAAVCADGQ